METSIDAEQLEQRRRAAIKSRSQPTRHRYFQSVAEARYILRKIFRLIEDEAKKFGIDPLAHQVLIQIYGNKDCTLRVKDIAERLDINPAFASSLVKLLVEKGLVRRWKNPEDKRTAWMTTTEQGKRLLHGIDEQVQVHVDYFNLTVTPTQRQAALSILLFYVGVSLRPSRAK